MPLPPTSSDKSASFAHALALKLPIICLNWVLKGTRFIVGSSGKRKVRLHSSFFGIFFDRDLIFPACLNFWQQHNTVQRCPIPRWLPFQIYTWKRGKCQPASSFPCFAGFLLSFFSRLIFLCFCALGNSVQFFFYFIDKVLTSAHRLTYFMQQKKTSSQRAFAKEGK